MIWMSGELGCFVLAKKWINWISRVCMSCWEGWDVFPATDRIVGRTLSKNIDRFYLLILPVTTYSITYVTTACKS